MTVKQRILKLLYPFFMLLNKPAAKPVLHSQKQTDAMPPVSFYTLSATLNNGKDFSFEQLKDKFVLIVNTASFCGYTGQYDDLEKLHQQYKHKLVMLGFPANDFGKQEPGSDEDIAEFCRVNFGVTFPLMQKGPVSGAAKQPVFEWLANPALNGWNDREPNWNFCKYLISPDGRLLGFYPSGVDPLSADITSHLA